LLSQIISLGRKGGIHTQVLQAGMVLCVLVVLLEKPRFPHEFLVSALNPLSLRVPHCSAGEAAGMLGMEHGCGQVLGEE